MAGPGVGTKSALLSCHQCRRRKTKCDRRNPCSYCVRLGVQCVPHPPSHAARGRQGGRPKANDELLQRIATLEHLVKEIETSSDETLSSIASHGQLARQVTGPESVGSDEISQPRKAPSLPGDGSIYRYLGCSLWRSLGDQIHGLREILDSPSEDGEEDGGTPDQSSHSSTPAHAGLESFVICGSGILGLDATLLQHPPQILTSALCDVYLSNVDRICKVVHAPSLRRYLCEGTEQLDGSPGPRGLEALRFAIFFSATNSLTAAECAHRFGEDKAVLLPRYRASTELALARADFVNTTEMSTLQALVLFVLAVRCSDSTRLSWTLLGLAVRIAQAIGLHREICIAPYPPFHREMRRRLWWRICVLDSQAATDRGTDPVILPGCFNTRLPLCIDDSDIGLEDAEEPSERNDFTDLTFSLVCSEIFDTVRRLNHVPADVTEVPQSSSPEISDQTRREWVVDCQTLVEDKYMRRCDLNDPFQYSTRMVADIIIATMWLIRYRPLQQHTSSNASNMISHPGILRLSVEVLEKSHHLNTSLFTKSVWWISKTYVQWHPLAVALAELCVQTEGPIVERAWKAVHVVYDEVLGHVADGQRGMLWRPINKLMNKAQSMRRVRSDDMVAQNSASQGLDVSMQHLPISIADAAPTSATNSFLDRSSDGGHGTTSMSSNSFDQFDWGTWLATPPTTQDFSSGVMDRAAMANWDSFLSDFQLDEGFPNAN